MIYRGPGFLAVLEFLNNFFTQLHYKNDLFPFFKKKFREECEHTKYMAFSIQ
jgi:hypothetical protein